MKYLKGSVTEINGGMEYQDNFILAFNEKDITEEIASMIIARDWRGGAWVDWDESSQGFWSDNSLIKPFCSSYVEISEEELETAKKYTSVQYVGDLEDSNSELYSDYFNIDTGDYIG